ncbi:MAG: methyltransferase domain-containing protein [Gammaproteobacteria bacterium]|nr:methyltransferase domain-containing protein [Gammaproteobacteria bacterium]
MSDNTSDRNFDGLVGHFQKNIYQTPKGRIRLDIIWRDLVSVLPDIDNGAKLRILDAGAGLGYMAGLLADHGHELVLCDVSDEILKQAEQHLSQHHPQAAYRLINSAVQELKLHTDEQFDLVLFHAVLEWLAEPRQVLGQLLDFIKPDGYLSLMFYNKHSLVYRHLLNANFKVLLQGEPRVGERLVPVSPLEPKQVENWLLQENVDIISQSGVRVIYDYLSHAEKQRIKMDELLEMERRYSRIPPYSDLARYQHFIVRR